MKSEKPILFSTLMVREILKGTKTQTRRVIKPQPVWVADPNIPFKTIDANPKGVINCPYRAERLWVRETWWPLGSIDGMFGYKESYPVSTHHQFKWKPSIFMPRCASRIILDVKNIRVERLQEITDEDALEEGVDRTNTSIPGYAKTIFQRLWDSINKNRGYGWDTNPWVWVIKFKRV